MTSFIKEESRHTKEFLKSSGPRKREVELLTIIRDMYMFWLSLSNMNRKQIVIDVPRTWDPSRRHLSVTSPAKSSSSQVEIYSLSGLERNVQAWVSGSMRSLLFQVLILQALNLGHYLQNNFSPSAFMDVKMEGWGYSCST